MPTVSFSPSSQTGWNNESITVNISNTFGISGESSVRRRLSTNNGSSYGTWVNESGNFSIALNTSGQHRIQTEVCDNAGNCTTATSGVYRVDVDAPTCVTSGGSNTWFNTNRTITGTCSDTGGSGCTGNVSRTFTNNINSMESPGEVCDAAGNCTTCPTARVRIDKTPPVITLNGSSTMSITLGDPFSDPGATASDNVDGNITSQIVTTGSVNRNQAGTYTITYTVSDQAGNTTSRSRTVTVNPYTEYRFRNLLTHCDTCYQTCTDTQAASVSYSCSSGSLSGSTCTMSATANYSCSSGSLSGTTCFTSASSSTSCNWCSWTVNHSGADCSRCGSSCNSCSWTENHSGRDCSQCGSTCDTCTYSVNRRSCSNCGSTCNTCTYSVTGASCSNCGSTCRTCNYNITGQSCSNCGSTCNTCTYNVTGQSCSNCGSTCNHCSWTTNHSGTNCSRCGSTTTYSCPSGWTRSGTTCSRSYSCNPYDCNCYDYWGSWSSWSRTVRTPSSTRQVETRTISSL